MLDFQAMGIDELRAMEQSIALALPHLDAIDRVEAVKELAEVKERIKQLEG